MKRIYRFNPSFTAFFLGAIAFALVLASIAGDIITHASDHDSFVVRAFRLFAVNGESNLPAAFSGFLLFFSALLLAFVAMCKKQGKTNALYWGTLSCIFFFLGLDELCILHERLEGRLGSNFLIFVIVLLFSIALFYLEFFRSLPAKTSRSFLVGTALYLGGAFIIDKIGIIYKPVLDRQSSTWQSFTSQSLTFSIFTHIEESLEMIGIIVMIWALLRYIADNYQITSINN